MVETLNVSEVTGAPDALFHQYPQASVPQGVYLEIDPQERSLRVDWDPEVNAIPESVWSRRRLRFFVSWPLTPTGANALLRDPKVQELAHAIIAGHTVHRDGGARWRGELDDEASAAATRLERLVNEWGDGPEYPDGYRVNVIDAFDWFSGLSGTGADWPAKLAAAMGLTASSTDEDLAVVAANEALSALVEGYHVVEGLAVFLADVRERLQP